MVNDKLQKIKKESMFSMEICFCLPNPSIKPSGGFKMVFEYANRLAEKGYKVKIVFDGSRAFKRFRFPELLRNYICFFSVKFYPRWFHLDNRIKKIHVREITEKSIPDGDIVIATAIETAYKVANLSERKGKKKYLIQGYENWNYTDGEVLSSYNLGMENIVISKWLKRIVDEKSLYPSIYIPNGIDFEVFSIDIPIDERNPCSIAMLYHKSENKGSKYGLEVIYRLKQTYPHLEVKLFGTPDRPHDLPKWIEYTKNATSKELRHIYNSSSIFLSTSIEEGFGLTGAESMACGCALVSTDYLGVFEYAKKEINALISPIKDVETLYQNVSRLINDNELRIELAQRGNKDIERLDWEKSMNLFEKTIKKDELLK